MSNVVGYLLESAEEVLFVSVFNCAESMSVFCFAIVSNVFVW